MVILLSVSRPVIPGEVFEDHYNKCHELNATFRPDILDEYILIYFVSHLMLNYLWANIIFVQDNI